MQFIRDEGGIEIDGTFLTEQVNVVRRESTYVTRVGMAVISFVHGERTRSSHVYTRPVYFNVYNVPVCHDVTVS